MERRKIHGSTHDDDNDSSLTIEHISLDLLGEILSRLPAKSIGRSRSVSKLWSSFTTTQGFINSFAARSSASSQPCALLIFSKGDKLFVFSSPQAESFQLTTIPRDGFLQRYDSVQGLIYLETSTQLMIWNPSMKHFFTLPEPEASEGKYITGSLGYDPIDCKYKALCHLTGDKIGILTLGSQESWRVLSQGFPSHYRRMTDCVICINGVIYYQCFSGVSLAHSIMSFDLRSEKFHLIKYPSRDGCFLVSYEGRLALMLSSNGRSGIELWILVNAQNHEWVYKHFPTPNLRKDFWVLRDMKLKGVTDAGEFIYVYTPFSMYRRRAGPIHLSSEGWSRFRVIYFDPKENSSREVKFPGIAIDDLMRLRVRGSDFMEGLSVVPNHIESLVSLY